MNLLGRTTAGSSANAYFREARAAWRRRVMGRVQPFLLVPGAMIFIAQVIWGTDALNWTLGIGAGARWNAPTIRGRRVIFPISPAASAAQRLTSARSSNA